MVSDSSSAIGMTIAGFVKLAGKDTEILGIVNENGSVSKVRNNSKIRPNQHLVMKVAPDHAAFIQDNFSSKANDDLDINKL